MIAFSPYLFLIQYNNVPMQYVLSALPCEGFDDGKDMSKVDFDFSKSSFDNNVDKQVQKVLL